MESAKQSSNWFTNFRTQKLKQGKSIIEGMKQDIKKEEEYLKNLTEKHKKAISLLSKCIGTQLSFLQKQRNFSINKHYSQMSFGNNYSKKVEKMKIANLKKQQNEEEIQNLNKQISFVQDQIKSLDAVYKQNLEKLEKERAEMISVKKEFIDKMEEQMQHMNNKKYHSSVSHTVYWSPFQEQPHNSSSQPHHVNKNTGISRDSRESLKNGNFSLHNSSSKNDSKNINQQNKSKFPARQISTLKVQSKKLIQDPIVQILQLEDTKKQKMYKLQTKRQIYELFLLISDQQKILSTVLLEKQDILSTKIINRIKNQQKAQIFQNIDEQELLKYLKEGKQFDSQTFSNFLKDEEIHNKISKELQTKKKKTQQTIAISELK